MEKWSFYVWRYSSRFTNYLLWSESDDLWFNSCSSKFIFLYVDLILTNQPNLVTESGVYPSLHRKCHHQIVFTKLNLNVEYPFLYERLICDYENANIPSINCAIEIFYWVIHSKVKMFMNQPTSLRKQSWIFFTTIFLKKLFFVMIKIHRGLIMRLEKCWLGKMRYSNSI